MKKIWLIILCILAFYNASHAQKLVDHLDSVMQVVEADSLFHGQILIAEKGEVLFDQAYGITPVNSAIQQEIDVNTAFCIESITKAFTAISILMLQNEGILSLQDELIDYFPQLPYKGVTIYQMLTMTSGLPRFLETVLVHADTTKLINNREIIELIARHQPASDRPGQRFSYNNSNYLLLASIIEKVSGMSYEGFLTTRIFEVLHMQNSYVGTIKESSGKGQAINANNFYQPYGEGNIYSTAEDLFKFEQALYTDKLIPLSLVSMLFKPTLLESGETSNYGLAWRIDVQDEQNEAYIIGEGRNTRVSIQRFMNKRNSFIYVHVYSAVNHSKVYQMVKNIWEGVEYTIPTKRVIHPIDTKLYTRYVGQYLSPTFGLLHVTSEADKLYIRPDPVPGREELIPSSDTTFYFGHQDLEWEFFKNKNGVVIGLSLKGDRDNMGAKVE